MKLGYRPPEAADVLGSEELLKECEAAGWISPKVRRHRLTLYCYTDLAKCWAKIAGGQLPPPLPRKHKEKEVVTCG